MAGVVWREHPEQVLTRLTQQYAAYIHAELIKIAQRYVPQIEAWMKQNAPWQDRTGNARQSLFADFFDIAQSAVVVILGHGVDYGVFLELSRAGAYAILQPALEYFAPRIWAEVLSIL